MRNNLRQLALLAAIMLTTACSYAQQLNMRDFVLFGGSSTCPSPGQSTPLAPGCGVVIGTSATVNGGKIGSYQLVQTTGNAQLNADLHSGGRIILSNSNTVSGVITAGGQQATTSVLFSAGSNFLGNNILVNGSATVSGGSVNGYLIHPSGTTYTGPVPAGSEIIGTPQLPGLPNFPAITTFPAAGTGVINNNQTLLPFPQVYGSVQLPGAKKLTFNGPGVYVFSSIKNTGNTNKFVFDFGTNTTDNFRIYVHGDVDLSKVNVEILGSGDASRIFMEVHGTGATSPTGTYAWMMTNGASGNNQSTWSGTVWAPYGGINVGSGSSPSKINGALWSGTQVVLDNGVSVTHVMLAGCGIPNANAGADAAIDCNNPTTQLHGSSTTPGAQLSWSMVSGSFTSTLANPVVSAGGKYVLSATNPSCGSTGSDTVIVTQTPCILPYYPPSTQGKVNTKIGSELTSLSVNFGQVSDSAKAIFILKSDTVLIDIIAIQGQYQSLKTLLINSYGLKDTISNGPGSLIITGWFPIANLPILNTLSSVNYCRPAFPAVSNAGIAMTQGDSAMRTGMVRNGFALTGDSIKVGVLSDSYNTLPGNLASVDVGNGDLPGTGNPVNSNPVQVLKEYPLGTRTDEGRAMLQIVHDVAPKAKLAFRTGFLTAGDFAQGIRELADSACNVIVDDITFITEPFFRPGVVESSIKAVTAQGVSYVTAAGNFGVKSYENIFNPATTALPAGLTGKAHNFGGGDIFQNDSLKGNILTPGIYTIVLQWEDDIYSLGNNSGTVNDLDIYLTDNNGVTLFGFNRNNLGGDPIEVLPFTVTANTATNVLIVNSSAGANWTGNLRFKYVVFRGDLKINEYNNGYSTIVGQGNADSAITVGAALYTNTPAYGVAVPTVASFSSRGGTPVNNIVRLKPDFVGPNGVNTTVQFGSIDLESDNRPNFFGTSAAAPHVAGAIALLQQARKRYYNQSLKPFQAKALLAAGAIDMDAPGFDFNTGRGFVNISASMNTIANPTPQLIRLELGDSSIVPGSQPLQLLIHGNFFSSGSKVLFGTDTLATVIVNDSLATTTIPAFTEERLVSVYTSPMTTSLLDGGLSNTISITGVPKKLITVIADDKTKKYGAVMPQFTATILVDGDSLQHTGLTLQQLGLQQITYTTPATSMSGVAPYIITPSRVFNPANTTDAALLAKYNYVFQPGVLTVQRLPVTVSPRDTTIVYGQKVGNIHFDYNFDLTVALDSAAKLLNIVTSSHQSLLANNVIGLVNGQAFTIVNGQAIPIVNGQAITLVNGQAYTIVNGQAIPIVNGQAITIVNGQAIPIVNSLTAQQTNNLSFMVSEASLQGARQITNTTVVNGVPVTQVTNVVDVTQESIIDYNVNPIQTELIQPASQTNARGIVSATALINGQALTLINGQAIPLVNGQAFTIVNGQAYTIVNGQAIPIVNSLSGTDNRTAVVVDQNDLLPTGVNNLKSINMVTGLTSGLQTIIPGALLNDNLEIHYEVGNLNIIPAPLTIKAKDSAKVYGQNLVLDGTRFTITAGSLQYGDAISSVSLQSAGAVASANAGSYAIVPSAATGAANTNVSNYTITYSNGTLTVGKVPLMVKAVDTTRFYGSVNPVFRASYTGFVNGQTFASSGITGTPLLTTTANTGSLVGPYPITAATGSLSSTNYSFSFQPGILTVAPSPLTVRADDKLIFFGDPTPNFTGSVSPVKNGDVANYTYAAPSYLGQAGIYPIVPTLVSFPKAGNYAITVVPGTLYVNPKGAGTKKLRPYLDCVEIVPNPAPGQYGYIAHFFCENTNSVPIYVPIGPDNKLTGTGNFDASNQPKLFLPGITQFDMPFDGTVVTWELKTFESNKKTSGAGVASSNSKNCNVATKARGEVSETIVPADLVNSEPSIFPNPASGKVTILTKGALNAASVRVFDAVGRNYKLPFAKNNEKSVQMDVTSLKPGIYFVSLSIGGKNEVLRFVKN